MRRDLPDWWRPSLDIRTKVHSETRGRYTAAELLDPATATPNSGSMASKFTGLASEVVLRAPRKTGQRAV